MYGRNNCRVWSKHGGKGYGEQSESMSSETWGVESEYGVRKGTVESGILTRVEMWRVGQSMRGEMWRVGSENERTCGDWGQNRSVCR